MFGACASITEWIGFAASSPGRSLGGYLHGSRVIGGTAGSTYGLRMVGCSC